MIHVPMPTKEGLQFVAPGAKEEDRPFVIRIIVSDYTGTLSCDGKLCEGVADLLIKLGEKVDIYVLTSDTQGTAALQLHGLPVKLMILEGRDHDLQKVNFIKSLPVPTHE